MESAPAAMPATRQSAFSGVFTPHPPRGRTRFASSSGSPARSARPPRAPVRRATRDSGHRTRARIVVFIATTSAATMRSRSPDPACESYPPGFELGSPVEESAGKRETAMPDHRAFIGAYRGQRLVGGREQLGDPAPISWGGTGPLC
jgi:hypothetical protein